MNVLGKIVVPRLLQSITYILSEIEEKAREEFFRMKKIVQLKKKHRMKLKTQVALKSGAKLEPIIEVEPIIEDRSVFKIDCEGCVICEAPKRDVSFIPIAPESIEDPVGKQLSAFKKQVADIIAATQNLEELNLLDETHVFVKEAKELQNQLQERDKNANNLRAKLLKVQKKRESDGVMDCPDFIPAGIEYDNLCPQCQLTYLRQYGTGSQQERKSSAITPPYSPPTSPLKQVEELQGEVLYGAKDDTEGIFETEIEVITKVIRKVHPDGTVTEDKKVIKIRRETKRPLQRSQNPDQMGRKGRLAYRSSNASYGSGLYHDSKHVGYAVPDEITPFRKLYSYSEIISSNSSMCYPVARYCVSIPNIVCSSEFDISKDAVNEFKNLSKKFENILDQYKNSKSGNIRTTIDCNSLLNESDTLLLGLLSEHTNFNFKSTSHFNLYKDIMVIPDLKCNSCTNVSNSGVSSKNE